MNRNLLNFIQITTLLFSISAFQSHAQQNILRNFAIQKNHQWQTQKKLADSIASKHQLQLIWIDQNNRVTELQRFEHGIPIYYQTENTNAAATISSNLTWEVNGFSPGLSGENRTAGIWDAGYVLQNHQELLENNISRIFQHDEPSYFGAHATHLSGTMIAAGVNSLSKGMASAGTIYAYDYNNDLAEMASEAADGLQVSNHSYGPISGWSYNSSDEMWYWYGDLDISTVEDLKFGLYTETSRDLDFVTFHAPEYLIVKSAGNDRNDAPENQPTEHYIWDENWSISTLQHNPDGGTNGYDCLSPMALAKNILTVGAVEDLPNGYTTSGEVQITPFSSWGPTDDGRIKPDLVANGMTILSCGSAEDTYIELSGTSMSAASISGSVLLLNELQEKLQPGVKLKSSTVKGLMIHTADECGPSPGPDYQHGWGLANILKAANLLKSNHANGGASIQEDILVEGRIMNIPIIIPSNSPNFKATICWSDPPGDIAPYVLNGPGSNLVNNLDIRLIQSSTQQNYYPWILNPSNPSLAASTGTNNYDNVEQIFINAPSEGAYTLRISHQNNLENGQQAFSIIISGIESAESIYPPENLTYCTGDKEVNLIWQEGLSTTANYYNIYRNGITIGTCTGLQFIDQTVENKITYSYNITAVYPSGEESLPTNTVFARPIIPKSMPYIMDCESGLEDWQLKAEISGWRLGDSDSLSCYYLDFSENTSQFLGIDSYTAGQGIHVNDIAISPPINLANYEDLTLSFDYMLITGIYGTTNEVHAMYRLNEASNWMLIANLPGALDWKKVQFPLPNDAAVSGCQLGFFYDDDYKQGMGAGLDNIQLSGTLNIQDDISLQSIDSPLSQLCIQEDPLNLAITIKNTGNTSILSGEMITITAQYNGIEKERNYTLTQDLVAGSSKTLTFTGIIDPLPEGTHILTVNISWNKDQNPSNNSKSKDILINPLPEISFTDPPDILCENSDPVQILALPAGGSFINEYMTANTFDPASAGLGAHEIIYTFTDANGCTNSSSFSVEVVSLPEVSFTGLSEFFCVNDPLVNLTGSPLGGTFSGPGIIENTFSPEVAGPGTHQIQYTYTDQNGCANSDSHQTTVYDLTPLSFVNLPESYCRDGSPIELSALPNGGTFSINEEIVDYLDPGDYPLGSIAVKYAYQNENGCIATLIEQVSIQDLPDVSITDPGDLFCLIDMEIKLVAQPKGGIFTGDLIAEDIFNPITSGIGPHEIIYSYNDGNGCENADTIVIEVLPLPEVSFTGLSAEYCLNEASSPLTGFPSGGIFTGDGMEGASFNPELSGVGPTEVTYLYSDENGCTNHNIQSTSVYELTEVNLLYLSDVYCQNDDPIELSAFPEGGLFFVNAMQNTALVPQELGPGNVEISYEYVDENGCTSTDQEIIEIQSLPEVGIDGLSEMYCQINLDYELTGSPEGGNFILEGEAVTHFNPVELGDGNFEIFYEYTDNQGCIGNTSQSILITTNPGVSIEGLAASYCPNGESVVVEGIPSGGYFEGSGMSDNIFSPNHLLPGSYQITYIYNLNGCETSAKVITTITEPVDVNISGLLPQYCPADSLAEVIGIPEGGLFNVTPLFEEGGNGINSYNLYYTYTDVNNCAFTDSARFEIFAKPEFATPNDLEVSIDDTLTLELANPELTYYWPNDSTSKALNLIGDEYEIGDNILQVSILDANGCQNIFEITFYVKGITAIPYDEKNVDIILYPNPAGKYLNIQMKTETLNVHWSITIFDLNGKWTNHWESVEFAESDLQLDVSNLTPGIYLISFSGNNQHITEKFNVIR